MKLYLGLVLALVLPNLIFGLLVVGTATIIWQLLTLLGM